MPTSIRFPLQVRQPDRSGYSDTYEETRGRTEMTTGADRVRQMHRSSPRLFTVAWTLDNAGYAAFDQWFQDIVGSGVREFDIQLLDRDEQLKWFTCKWFPPAFDVSTEEWDRWELRATLWSNSPPFDTREAGTDELHGTFAPLLKTTGGLKIGVSLFGSMGAPGYIDTLIGFLDTFTGSGALSAHTPDIAPDGFAYFDSKTGPNTDIALTGGHAVTVPVGYGASGVADSSASDPDFVLDMTTPYTVTFVARPSSTLADSVVGVVLDDTEGDANIELSFTRSAGGVYKSTATVNDAVGFFYEEDTNAAGEHTISVYVEAGQCTVSFDGVASAPVDMGGAAPVHFNRIRYTLDYDHPTDDSYIDRFEITESHSVANALALVAVGNLSRPLRGNMLLTPMVARGWIKTGLHGTFAPFLITTGELDVDA